jgi:hypothetical protein
VIGRHSYTEVSLSQKGDEITTRGYRVLTYAEWTTFMIAELAFTSGLGSSLDYMGIG